jgi:hypothetical protein
MNPRRSARFDIADVHSPALLFRLLLTEIDGVVPESHSAALPRG